MNRMVFTGAFVVGAATLAWVGAGFVGTSWTALAMSLVMAAVYLVGALELKRFRASTMALAQALTQVPQPTADIAPWLAGLPNGVRQAVRLRVEGERAALPGPALTPYLVGLLVMLGMLGTFVGMVMTFKGAVFALEGSADLQAIRAALAAPIKGLGLAFGTSVAGVASSAMLGLMSALARRERAAVAHQLDTCLATTLRPLSAAHQRQATYQAMLQQAQTMPALVDRLQGLMESIDRRSQQLQDSLVHQQAQFHQEAQRAYAELARDVGTSLKESLAASAQAAGDSLVPVVSQAMASLEQASHHAHQRLTDSTRERWDQLARDLAAVADRVGQGWSQAQQDQIRTSEQLTVGLERSLAQLTHDLEQRSGAWLTAVEAHTAQAQAAQAQAEAARQQAWTTTLEQIVTQLQQGWQQAGDQQLAQQQAVCAMLEKTAVDITERSGQHAARTADDIGRLLAQTEALVQARVEGEARWAAQQHERMDGLTTLWREQLGALRDDEAARGQAAVDRLGELQTAVAGQLATLGAALETPLSRLLQTAAEVPQAAAEVITQMRQEMTRLSERDNLAQHERHALVQQLGTLLLTLEQTAGAQRAAVESLVASAAQVLNDTAGQWAQTLQSQAGASATVAAQLTSSAVELASLGEAFQHGVSVFSASNDKLVDGLQRVESSIQQSIARSDEQLAYYVAQAREVIDLSITSQQSLVEDLRRLRAAPTLEGSAT